MSRLQVVFINKSTVVQDDQITAIVSALQKQVDHDFRPTWGMAAQLSQLPAGSNPPADQFWVGIFDDSDQAGALGYHDLTPAGMPVSKVFAKTDLDVGAELSVTCSHEVLEMLGDPDINLTAFDSKTGREYAYENADAVEADGLGYEIDGIKVSDFVLRPFFTRHRAKGHATLSFCEHVSEPFSLAPGGYLSYIDLNNPQAGWQQVTAQEAAQGARHAGFPPGSRRERRIRATEDGLLVSEVETA